MLPVDELPYAEIPNVDVPASNSIFKELGNNTYDFVDLISELIDNSIAAMVPDELLRVHIQVAVSELDPTNSYLILRDDASGIPRESLGVALSPGGMSGGSTLNEHGLGMKQAMSALGDLKYIATKTAQDDLAIVIEELKYGGIMPKQYDVEWSHGTEICVQNLNAIVPTGSQSYTKTVPRTLGARYRRFLRPDARKMTLELELLDLDDTDEKGAPAVINSWTAEQVKPVYFHPNERQNKPVEVKHKFSDTGWEAYLTLGYAPTDEEYDELGLEPPKKYDPYYVSLSKQGLDLIKNDRVIRFHQLSEIDLVDYRHNRYNLVRGELDLKKGFTSAITKNFIIGDAHFLQLMSQVREFLDAGGYLKKKTYPDELPERLLRDRLAYHLRTRKMQPYSDVVTEYAVGGLNGYVDVLADGHAFELKVAQATGLDVYQLFAYLDMGGIAEGYLIAPSFGTGAEEASKHISTTHGKPITLAPLDEFPINHTASLEEIKKYY